MSATGSGIEGLRADCAFARQAAAGLVSETFKLIDVGCSGGLPDGFRQFGDRLAALAFDGLADEVARLAAEEANPLVRYVAGFVGLPADHPVMQRNAGRGEWHNWPSGRYAYERQFQLRRLKAEGKAPTSIAAYFKDDVLGQDWSTRPFPDFDTDYLAAFAEHPPSAPQTEVGPDNLVWLSAFAEGAGFSDADFLKIDIDGPDWVVLRSAGDLLARPTLLGAALEVNFVGSHDANDNTFHNTDRLMRQKGFHLVALSVRTYSSAALPFPYLDTHPSMNSGGRPVQGDAVYLRDLGSRSYADMAAALSDEKLLKAAALLALFNLPDYAAEMLLVHRERLARLIDVDRGLDLLAEQIQQDEAEKKTYADYIQAFEREEVEFFDLYGRRNRWMNGLIRTATEAPHAILHLQDEAQALQSEAAALRERAAEAEARAGGLAEEAASLRRELDDLRASTSWKLTAPVRKLLSRGR